MPLFPRKISKHNTSNLNVSGAKQVDAFCYFWLFGLDTTCGLVLLSQGEPGAMGLPGLEGLPGAKVSKY